MDRSFLQPGDARALLIDLDGTLVDSAGDLALAVDETMAALGRQPHGLDPVRLWVGNGAAMLVKRALAGSMDPQEVDQVDAALLDKAVGLFFAAYEKFCSQKTVLYPGVLPALEAWRAAGVKLACVTNKPEVFTERVLAAAGIRGFFDLVAAGDTLAVKKPDPAPLLYCMETMNTNLAQTWMIGDSRTDIKAARAAGIPVVCVSYGYNHGRDIRLENPDQVIDRFTDLLP